MARTPKQLEAWAFLLELCLDECQVFETSKAMREAVVEVERELKRLHAIEEAAIEAAQKWHKWIASDDFESLQNDAMEGVDGLLEKIKIYVPSAFPAPGVVDG